MKKQKPRPKLNSHGSNWTTLHWGLLIFLLAFAFRVDTIFSSKRYTRVVRGMEMQTLAESLAQTGTFANPFRYPTGPTPIWPRSTRSTSARSSACFPRTAITKSPRN